MLELPVKRMELSGYTSVLSSSSNLIIYFSQDLTLGRSAYFLTGEHEMTSAIRTGIKYFNILSILI